MLNITRNMRIIGFWLSLLVVVVFFSSTLGALLTFGLHSDLESHIVLIPFISGYLLLRQRTSSPEVSGFSVLPAGIIFAVAMGLLGLQLWLVHGDKALGQSDVLFLPVVAFVVSVIGLYVLFFSIQSFRRSAFPLLFLFAMAPLPECVAHWMRLSLQQWSAEAAYAMFCITGTPVFREGMVMSLSGLTIEVAEECSGLHSSLVLFITSMLASHLFLRKPWSKLILVVAVIPLGVLRNGFRVLVISLLTIHVDPEIIHGPLHHKGGPIFFALSLGVFLGLLGFLRWCEGMREGTRHLRFKKKE